MATFKIKKEKDKVVVVVDLIGLPPKVAEAEKAMEVIRTNHVRQYLEQRGISVIDCLKTPGTLSNFSGQACSAEFIFSIDEGPSATRSAPADLQIKSLTNDSKAAIINKDSKSQRKRAKRETKTGNRTTG